MSTEGDIHKRSLEEQASSPIKKQKIEQEAQTETVQVGPGVPPPAPATCPTDVPTPGPVTNQAYPRPTLLPNPLPIPVSRLGLKPKLPILPPSLEVITGRKAQVDPTKGFVGEEDVGIIGYAGPKDVQGVRGVIKQRFADFMVNEITLAGEVVRLKDISKPHEPELEEKKDKAKGKGKEQIDQSAFNLEDLPESLRFEQDGRWPLSTTFALRDHFSDETIASLHALYKEGKEPPAPVADSGWGQRVAKPEDNTEEVAANALELSSGGRGQGRDRGRGRGRGRGGRGGGRGGGDGQWSADTRTVVSQPINDKEKRGAAHKILRELFPNTWESSARDAGEQGQQLVIKWARGHQRKVQGEHDKLRKNLPPYIHFSMHKTNRETQDALGHVARQLGVMPKDLSVCGTKDKRAITVQRVCLRRGDRTLTTVWNSLNGIKNGRRNEKTAVEIRGERGVRIGDLSYSKQALTLGDLKGNRFLITLRSVEAGRQDEVDLILSSLRDHGFINFYGMQRFGTSTVPTHVTGLHLLKGEWTEAVDSVLSLREGEHPDCISARLAWLEDGDYNKSLELMPRRCVAERSIWEYWSRGHPLEDRLGTMSNIPRNMRSMYVHAYQSYIWNLVTSERVKQSSTEPLVGDLVFVDKNAEADDGVESFVRKDKSLPDVKRLSQEDLKDYTIFDVVMPLPGWNIQYPGGEIGELYGKMLKADGLDANNMRRDQREYSLPGSYRKIIHRPSLVEWRHIRYTDTDIPLTQADEDKILGENPPASDDPAGKFAALQIELELSSSVYATMALREVTREETSTWHQAGLTLKGEDREFKGTGGGEGAEGLAEVATGATEEEV